MKDEKVLYDLNADITKVIRKNANSEAAVKRIMKTFKEQNPQLIERLRNKIRSEKTETSRSSKSSNIRESESSNIITSKDSAIGVLVRDTESSINLMSSKERTNTQKRAPKVIYSTTDIDEAQETRPHLNYTTVRSSNELLNTVIRNDDNESEHLCEDSYNTHGKPTDMQMAINNNETDETCLPEAFTTNERNTNLSISRRTDSFDGQSSEKGKDDTSAIDVDMTGDNHTVDSVMIIDEESEIAEALTQVLEEYSRDDITESEIDFSQTDEDLMRETVLEINDSFAIESLVLTPPFDFRD